MHPNRLEILPKYFSKPRTQAIRQNLKARTQPLTENLNGTVGSSFFLVFLEISTVFGIFGLNSKANSETEKMKGKSSVWDFLGAEKKTSP